MQKGVAYHYIEKTKREPEVKHVSQILLQKRKLENIKCNYKGLFDDWQPIPQKPSSDPTYS